MRGTLCPVLCDVLSALCSVLSVPCVLSVLSALTPLLCSVLWTLCTLRPELSTRPCALDSVYSVLCALYSLYSVPCALCSLCRALCVLCCVLPCALQSALCAIQMSARGMGSVRLAQNSTPGPPRLGFSKAREYPHYELRAESNRHSQSCIL
jgi:hypothetical protein